MSANAAYNGAIDVDDGGGFDNVCGTDSIDPSFSVEQLETTEHCQTVGGRKRINGLLDATISISGYLDQSDAGQAALISAFLNKTSILVRWRPDGTNGWEFNANVSQFDPTAAVDGRADVSFTLELNDGVLTSVP